MNREFQKSIILIRIILPVSVIVIVITGSAIASYLDSSFLGLILMFLGVGFFYVYAKSDKCKRAKDSHQLHYATDWKGNRTLLYGDFWLPFSDSLFTVRVYDPSSRIIQEVRRVGITDLTLTIKWRPDKDNIHEFMKSNESDIGKFLFQEYTAKLNAENGTLFVYPEEQEKYEEVKYDFLGVIATRWSAERVEPLKTLDNEEPWFQYKNYQIGVLNNEPVFLSEDDATAHVQIIGASRYGKSKLIEHIARQIIYYNHFGLCVFDPNQQLYDDLLNWCVHRGHVSDSIHFLDLSDEKSTIGFNPFRLNGVATPQRITARANRLLRTTLKSLGIKEDTAIQAQRIIRCLYYVVIEQNLPITELKSFFTPRLFDRRDEIMAHCKSEDIYDQWQMLTAGKKDDTYITMMQSSANRLFDFVSEGGVQRLFTNPHQIDIAKITEKGEILIINLGKSDIMPSAARKVIGTFLIDEIWDVMSGRS